MRLVEHPRRSSLFSPPRLRWENAIQIDERSHVDETSGINFRYFRAYRRAMTFQMTAFIIKNGDVPIEEIGGWSTNCREWCSKLLVWPTVKHDIITIHARSDRKIVQSRWRLQGGTLENVFIEGAVASISQSLRKYWATKPRANLINIACQKELFVSKLQKQSDFQLPQKQFGEKDMHKLRNNHRVAGKRAYGDRASYISKEHGAIHRLPRY